jgi:histidinol-phosphate aminotransferase
MAPLGLTVVRQSGEPAGARPRIDLSLNESSFGASPAAILAARRRAATTHRYPDPASAGLRDALGRRFDLDPELIVCGNGSEELLDILGRLYARPGDEILHTQHGFLQFPIIAARVGATAVQVPERDLVVDVDRILERVTPRSRIVFLANPNNPTGTWIGRPELERLRAGLPPSVVLVIDSAYAEFVADPAYTSGLDLVDGTANVVVTRTFSKAYGLAALRVGWAHGPAAIIAALRRLHGVNVNAVAQAAAVAALEDDSFLRRSVAATATQSTRLADGLRRLGLDVPPSAANFLLVGFGSPAAAASAFRALAGDGIHVRPVDDYGLPDRLRITTGAPPETDAVLDVLTRHLAASGAAE